MAKTDNLTDFLTGLADKFRSKLGGTALINPQNFESKIDEVYQKGYDSAPQGVDTSDATAAADDVLQGKIFYGADGVSQKGTIVERSSLFMNYNSYTPGQVPKVGFKPAANGYVTTDSLLTVLGPNLTNGIGLTADKLLKGESVLYIEGSATSDATATAADILSGKTAYVNGVKLTGTAQTGSSATEPYIEETYDTDGNLTAVNLHGYTKIRNSLFSGCSSLALESLPAGIQTIGDYAFLGCSSLALENLPAGIQTIGDSAFRDCTSLVNTLNNIPETLTEIASSAFNGCESLVFTKLPSTISVVGGSAFSYCKGLQFVEIACNTLASGRTFGTCTNLQKVWIRKTCTTIAATSAYSAPFAGDEGHNGSLTIYLEYEEDEIPAGFGSYWKRYGNSGRVTATVVYGQTTCPW